MSLWGLPLIAPDAYLIPLLHKLIFFMQECLGIILDVNNALHKGIDNVFLFSSISVG